MASTILGLLSGMSCPWSRSHECSLDSGSGGPSPAAALSAWSLHPASPAHRLLEMVEA